MARETFLREVDSCESMFKSLSEPAVKSDNALGFVGKSAGVTGRENGDNTLNALGLLCIGFVIFGSGLRKPRDGH